jgi:hypothetical protein
MTRRLWRVQKGALPATVLSSGFQRPLRGAGPLCAKYECASHPQATTEQRSGRQHMRAKWRTPISCRDTC